MTRFLRLQYAVPQEREFEGWIMAGIDDYQVDAGFPIFFMAISQHLEHVYPTDEIAVFEGKVIGLQMKRPSLATANAGQPRQARHLHWDLSNPVGQFALVFGHPEIYYCLPTFTNRDSRHAALDHCIFWRPQEETDMAQVWYHNTDRRVKTSYKSIKGSMRWGLLVEEVLACNLGKPIKKGTLFDYLYGLQSALTGQPEGSALSVLGFSSEALDREGQILRDGK